MNYAAIRDLCRRRFGDNGDVLTDADWLEYINEAWRWFQSSSPWWPWRMREATVTVAANSATATLPDKVWHVIAVLNTTDDVLLRPFARRDERYAVDPEESATGTPTRYEIGTEPGGSYGGLVPVLRVWPTPTQSTVVRYQYITQASDLSTSVEPAFPPLFTEALVERALALAYLDDENIPISQAHQAEAASLLAVAGQQLLATQEHLAPELRDDWWA